MGPVRSAEEARLMIRRRVSIAPSHAEWLLEVAGDEIDARWAGQ